MRKLLVIIPLVFLLGNLYAFGVENPRPWIRSELKRLGFDTATIAPHIGGVYTVQITRFKPTGPALALSGKFRSFKLHVKPVKGKLYIDHECLIKEHYTVSVRSIPGRSPIIMSKFFRKYIGTSNRELSQINAAIASVKDYRMRGRIKIANVLSKARIVESLINDCSVPNPATDIPKIRIILQRLGLQTGDIQLMKGKEYKIHITGVSPAMKSKFESEASKPIELVGRMSKDRLYIKPESLGEEAKAFGLATTLSGLLDDNLEVAPALRFIVIERQDLPYKPCPSVCSCWVDNVETAENNSRGRYEFLGEVLSEVEEMRDYVEDRCSRENLTNPEKTSLQNFLTTLVEQAENQKDEFDRYIEDIEKFSEEYNDCKANEPLSP